MMLVNMMRGSGGRRRGYGGMGGMGFGRRRW